MNRPTRTALCLLICLALFPIAEAEVQGGEPSGETAVTPQAIQSARARWETLSPHEQERLRRRFEQLQKLDPGQREKLRERTQRRHQFETRVRSGLSAEQRARLKDLSPAQRREVISELVDQEMRDKGRRIESKLPRKMREWLRNASPEEREARLERFKSQTRGRISARAVEGLAKALGYGESEIKRLERLPMDERMATVMRLRKQLTAKQLRESGLPRGLTKDRWEALEALPPEEFLREVWRLQSRGILSGVIGLPRGFGPGPQTAEHRRRRQILSELRRAMHLNPEQLLELSRLPRAERRLRMIHLRRVQAMEVLRRHDILEPGELKDLDALSDEALLELVRARVQEWKPRDRGPKPRGSRGHPRGNRRGPR